MRKPKSREFKYDIMAVGAHPDDVEHGIGGSLIQWRKMGMKIVILHMTGGEMGTHGSKGTRRKEALAAAKTLKCDVDFLGLKDTEVRFTIETRNKFIRAVRKHRPRVIVAQYHDYPRMHPDHEQTGLIVKNAFRPCRFAQIKTPPHAPHWVENIYWHLFPFDMKPSFVVDVTDVMPAWEKVAACYESQLDSIPNYRERLMRFRRLAGAHIGVPYGEAFLCDVPLNATGVDITRFSPDPDYKEEERARGSERSPQRRRDR
jgi:LmbE family N-acetylglucosaminyl deacetylase